MSYRSHKKGNLVIHTIRGYFNAVTKGMSLVNDYLTHQPCETCKKAGVLGKAALDEKREQEARLVEEARQLQAQKAWYDAQVGVWDFTPIPMGTSEVMDQFRDIIRSGSDGKWLPDGFKLTHKLNRNRGNEVIWSDDTPEVWSAAILRLLTTQGQHQHYNIGQTSVSNSLGAHRCEYLCEYQGRDVRAL